MSYNLDFKVLVGNKVPARVNIQTNLAYHKVPHTILNPELYFFLLNIGFICAVLVYCQKIQTLSCVLFFYSNRFGQMFRRYPGSSIG